MVDEQQKSTWSPPESIWSPTGICGGVYSEVHVDYVGDGKVLPPNSVQQPVAFNMLIETRLAVRSGVNGVFKGNSHSQ